jgi:hypothetical protein
LKTAASRRTAFIVVARLPGESRKRDTSSIHRAPAGAHAGRAISS